MLTQLKKLGYQDEQRELLQKKKQKKEQVRFTLEDAKPIPACVPAPPVPIPPVSRKPAKPVAAAPRTRRTAALPSSRVALRAMAWRCVA